ncbi:hypothetical protein PSP6_270209 [Paraburkholderia tropica]|nr:hypothetical protein PSP6_270209 [Paraburkholderia tropica]
MFLEFWRKSVIYAPADAISGDWGGGLLRLSAESATAAHPAEMNIPPEGPMDRRVSAADDGHPIFIHLREFRHVDARIRNCLRKSLSG